MNEYTYFMLGTLLGLAVATYFWISKEEKEEKAVKLSQHLFSTKKLDITMETITKRISNFFVLHNFLQKLCKILQYTLIKKCVKVDLTNKNLKTNLILN